MSSIVDGARATVVVAVSFVPVPVLVVAGCASKDSALSIYEAADVPVGTEAAISASYK